MVGDVLMLVTVKLGRSRNKHGPAVGAPRRRARFDVVIRRLHRSNEASQIR